MSSPSTEVLELSLGDVVRPNGRFMRYATVASLVVNDN